MTASLHVCPLCHDRAPRAGWCAACAQRGEWIQRMPILTSSLMGHAAPAPPRAEIHALSDVPAREGPRLSTGLPDVDRVLGGGIVPGSVIVLGGDPGLGKSALWLQIAAAMPEPALVVAGEEPEARIRERAERLALDVGGISITSTVEVEALEETPLPFPLVIVDSLNTLRASTAPPSEHAQLVASTRVMVRRARAEDVAMLLVAQVTKDGSLSGPKAVEHLVDVVLWLTRPDASRPEREERELWCSKNRYGSTADVAVFLMTAKGLTPKFDASRFGQGGSGA